MVLPPYTPTKNDEIVYQGERLVVVRVDEAAVQFRGDSCSGRVTRGTWMGMWKEASERRQA